MARRDAASHSGTLARPADEQLSVAIVWPVPPVTHCACLPGYATFHMRRQLREAVGSCVCLRRYRRRLLVVCVIRRELWRLVESVDTRVLQRPIPANLAVNNEKPQSIVYACA